jgi:very-short-patch-repair endonuclease
VIGIDHYREWIHLNNAVSDACGVLAAFEDLGFVPISAPLLDDAATADAIRCLPFSLEPELKPNDSLIVFFAGHGHTTTVKFPDGQVPKGYLIPVDADHNHRGERTWQRIEPWLSTIAELPALNILVILDSCHSGIALSSDIHHRGMGVRCDDQSILPHQRRSRRILTSALNNQRASDAGPMPGHSVFTGYLIEALRGGARLWQESSAISMNEIAEYVRRRVREHSHDLQTPVTGRLEFDDSGELLVPLKQSRAVSPEPEPGPSGGLGDRAPRAGETRQPPGSRDRRRSSKASAAKSAANSAGGTVEQPPAHRAAAASSQALAIAPEPRSAGSEEQLAYPASRTLEPRTPVSAPQSASARRQPAHAAISGVLEPRLRVSDPQAASAGRPPPRRVSGELEPRPRMSDPRPASPERQPARVAGTQPHAETGLPHRTEGWILDPALATALDRQGEERRLGASVLTVVAGDALAAQTSWGTWAACHGYLTLATQAVGLEAVIADLLAQTPWLRCVPEARKRLAAAARIDVAAVDASVDAREGPERRTWIEDVAAGDPHVRVSGWLLSWLRRASACAPDPSTAPVRPERLLPIACDLASPTAVLLFHPAPDEQWLERAIVTAAQLVEYLPAHSVAVTAPDELVTRMVGEHRHGGAWTMARQGLVRVEALARRLPGRARHSTMRVLFDALARDPRTRGRFELDGRIATADGPSIDVALVAHDVRIAVELDAWYHFHDPEGYRRDRVQDTRLARAGYFVLRFPAEDVDDRLASTIEHLAIALAGRRAVRALL